MKQRALTVLTALILFVISTAIIYSCGSDEKKEKFAAGEKCLYDGVTECSDDTLSILECKDQVWEIRRVCNVNFGEFCRLVGGKPSCNENPPVNGDTGTTGGTGDTGSTGGTGNTGDTGNTGQESCEDSDEDDRRTVPCGHNGNGEQEQVCRSEVWVNFGDCDDPDECKNGSIREVACGMNDEGSQSQICEEGKWENEGGCADPDGCINGTTQTIKGVVSKCVSGEWIYYRETKQWGTDKNDQGKDIFVDKSGSIYVAGNTEGSMGDQFNSGKWDIFVTKWNKDISEAWTRIRGTADWDYGESVAVDNEGNVYATGSTRLPFDGNPFIGDFDAVLIKWNSEGEWVWTRQWGTDLLDEGRTVLTDSDGNIFVAGKTMSGMEDNDHFGSSDIFLSKFDPDGDMKWTKQWGTSGPDEIKSAAIDIDGNIYITGYTGGHLGGEEPIGMEDIFVKKIDNDGNLLFTRILGTPDRDIGNDISVDNDGNIFITGQTYGVFQDNSSDGNWDFFIMKLNTEGDLEWVNQRGTVSGDIGVSVDVDQAGNVYAVGTSAGNFDGHTGSGYEDIFLIKYDPSGKKLWSKLWGSKSDDSVKSIALDYAGNIFITGYTSGSIDFNKNIGGHDIFLTIWPAQ